MYKSGLPIQQIASILKMDVEELEKMMEEI